MAERVCPVWIGYLLASPVRKLLQNPEKILAPYIKEGMNVLDIGCAMGFFSLPLARMVGTNGKVICADIQEKMLVSLGKRARKAGLSGRIRTRLCQNPGDLDDLRGEIDFALAFAVVHEVPDASAFFTEIYNALKPEGDLLMGEPKGHVSEKDFEVSVSVAQESGFKVVDRPSVARSLSALLKKIG